MKKEDKVRKRPQRKLDERVFKEGVSYTNKEVSIILGVGGNGSAVAKKRWSDND